MPYHVKVTQKSGGEDAFMLNLTREALEEKILGPYLNGEPLMIDGYVITHNNIARVKINHTEKSSQELLPEIKAELRAAGAITIAPDEWHVTQKGQDVTNELLIKPPKTAKPFSTGEATGKKNPRAVFVIHGRDEDLKNSMFDFLRSLDLQPLEWEELVSGTGEGSPFIGLVVEKAFTLAQAVLVMLTPDDYSLLRKDLVLDNDPNYEKIPTLQPRPNVIFEAGMALGIEASRTIIVEIGKVKPFSDLSGRHVIKLNNDSEKRNNLKQRLENAGCPVNTKGSDWLKKGSFEIAEKSIKEEIGPKTDEGELDDQSLEILKFICSAERKPTLPEIARSFEIHREKTNFHLDVLIRQRFIRQGRRTGSRALKFTTTYLMTETGRAYLGERGLLP